MSTHQLELGYVVEVHPKAVRGFSWLLRMDDGEGKMVAVAEGFALTESAAIKAAKVHAGL